MQTTLDMAPAPRVPRTRGKDSREQLIAIAAKLFREKGYTATSIRDIVKRAKVEPSALYYHFKSKEALLDEVLDRSIQTVTDEVRVALGRLAPEATARDRFRAAIATHLRSNLAHGDFALASRRVLGQAPLGIRRKHESMRAAYGASWQQLFEHGVCSGELRSDVELTFARMFLLGALNWTSEWFDTRRKSSDDMADFFCALLFDGLARTREVGNNPVGMQ